MNLEKYTQKSQEALLGAQRLAEGLNHQTIEPSHLLLALVEQEDGVAPAIVTKVAGSVLAIREELQKELDKQPKVYGGSTQVGLSRPAADTLKSAEKFAKLASKSGFTTEVEVDEDFDSFTCYCSRSMLLDYDELIAIQKQLDQLADPLDGWADGWGTLGNVA